MIGLDKRAEHAMAILSTPPHTPPSKYATVHTLTHDYFQEEIPDPTLLHTLHQQDHSVLSVAADDKYIFSGSQGDEIYVSSPLSSQYVC